jgi:hypothetical protein
LLSDSGDRLERRSAVDAILPLRRVVSNRAISVKTMRRATTAHILGRPPSNEPRTPGRELVRLVPRLASRRIVRAPRRARAVRFLSAGTAATAGKLLMELER